jgi:hypothetical protein
VLYGHGGAVWVKKDVFWNDLKNAPVVFDGTGGSAVLTTDNAKPDTEAKPLSGVWMDLDYGAYVSTAAAPPPGR